MTEAECHEAGVHFGPVCATHVILEDSEDFKICNRGDTPAERPPVTKREIDNRANVVTEQKTVTAPPAVSLILERKVEELEGTDKYRVQPQST